ncbi:hypothetical protein [Roseibium marinum]|uniref:Uncharacterized protein n=1 Tax=Roseibium marinum TaxID=281252 RepID=A0A2S3UXD9_9HYPH|nr:hypothetical protein [Roseibium marinum]POF32344.1 hypothetical protein CLV41_103267 [Roseibium marinum]
MQVSISVKAILVLAGVAVSGFFTSSGQAAWTGASDDSSLDLSVESFGSHEILGEFKRPDPNAGLLQLAFSDDVTQAIVNQIQRGAGECSRLEAVYRLDCLQRVFAQASGAAGRKPDYSAANGELRKLSKTLKGIVGKNQDRKAPKAKLGNKSYRAVSQAALREVNKLASKAIEEATTKLLRSAGNSKKRKVHYTRIANAVNSTKKILRS